MKNTIAVQQVIKTFREYKEPKKSLKTYVLYYLNNFSKYTPIFMLKIVKLSIYYGIYGALNVQRLIFLSKSIKETYVITKQRNQA